MNTDSARELLREALDDCNEVLQRMEAEGQRKERIEYQRDLIARIATHLSAPDADARDAAVIANLSMMLRRMVWQVNRLDGDSTLKVLAGKADGLIKQYGLQGSPLRGDTSAAQRDDVVVVPRECQHPRQKWSVNMQSGHCEDCGAQLGQGEKP